MLSLGFSWHFVTVLYGITPFLLTNTFGKAWPRIRAFFVALRESTDSSIKIGTAGFCWGGRPVFTLAHQESVTADGKPLVDAVFTGHPSLISLPTDAQKVTQAFSIALGEKDGYLSLEQLDVIKKAFNENSHPSEVVVYPSAGHGFCTRVDPRNENQFRQSKEAEDQAVAWFQKHLTSPTS
jgi:dienelactone hydrolase